MVATTSKDKLMTEAEILAMPEDDYMNPAQMEFFRLRLSLMRDELLENAASTGANLRENELVADPADRATVEEEHALELRVRDRERKLIKKIEETMDLIDSGDYGYCAACGVDIGIKRLEARPTATLCIDCKTLEEVREKQIAK